MHHIDLNFGCPVRKVTAKGGGSALPLRPRLFRRLVAAAAAAAGPEVPVTVKLRMGLGPELMTFLQVGLGHYFICVMMCLWPCQHVQAKCDSLKRLFELSSC